MKQGLPIGADTSLLSVGGRPVHVHGINLDFRIVVPCGAPVLHCAIDRWVDEFTPWVCLPIQRCLVDKDCIVSGEWRTRATFSKLDNR